MISRSLLGMGCWAMLCSFAIAQEAAAPAKDQFTGLGEKVTAAFNSGNAAELAQLFVPEGEWIDENGTLFQGREEIQTILTAYFQQFPGATLRLQPDSIRNLGPAIAIEEGLREVVVEQTGVKLALRYITVLTKGESGWQIASLRDFEAPPVRSPGDYLQPLAWLEGEWVNEGTDSTVQIRYRWDDDANFLLGEYVIFEGHNVKLRCEQRIGWDPLVGAPRSWMFDSDGGYAEGRWTPVEDGWVVKSQAVLPDGTTGSATLALKQISKDRFTMKGTERIAGNDRDDDFEVTIVKRPATVKTIP